MKIDPVYRHAVLIQLDSFCCDAVLMQIDPLYRHAVLMQIDPILL